MPDPTFPDGWSIFDQAPGAMALADGEMVIVRANEAFCRLVGRPAATMVGHSGFGFMHPSAREVARERLDGLRSDGEGYAVDQRFTHSEGHDLWLHVRVTAVDGPDGERWFMAQVDDTTDHRRTTARLQRLAERDHLTGLLNRRRVEEELEAVLAGARRHGHRAALIVADLDHFKAVNDREGHEAGDRVLSFVAATLATRVREEDAVGRLGGDEFAVILRDTSLESAEAVAAELVELVAEAGYTQERGVTLSAGVAALGEGTRSAQDALHAADLAMYAAKTAGRDRVAVHSPVAGPTVSGRERGVRIPVSGAVALAASERLDGLQAVVDRPTVDNALASVRELLGLDVSYVTRIDETHQVQIATSGDVESFGVGTGVSVPLEDTYCQRILDGRLPGAMADVGAHAEAAALEVTGRARVGAFIAVPIRLSDGSLYGTLCAAGHDVHASLGERDLQFLGVLGRLLGGELERDAALRTQLGLRAQAAGAEALLSAIEARDRYTGAHSREVVELATQVAVELELDEDVQREVAQVALLHDIGKLAVPDAILSKPGPLTYDEIVQMRRHPLDGERIVAAIPELKHLASAIRAEHERWDGLGYPDGLAGERIPISSRIVFVCDAWDAMTSDRPYRGRMARDEALAQLAAGASTQFCLVSVQALFNVLSRG